MRGAVPTPRKVRAARAPQAPFPGALSPQIRQLHRKTDTLGLEFGDVPEVVGVGGPGQRLAALRPEVFFVPGGAVGMPYIKMSECTIGCAQPDRGTLGGDSLNGPQICLENFYRLNVAGGGYTQKSGLGVEFPRA